MDTTSHNFTWQTFTFGGGSEGDSRISDVTIVNDTLIYAAGEIYIDNSNGTMNTTPYCLVQWNGQKWSPSRLKFFPPGAIGDSMNAIGTSIFANKKDDIWFSAGTVFHFDGIYWTPVFNTLGAEGAIKLWSDGNGHTWFVGSNGLIVRYANNIWQKIGSGTSTYIMDVWGTNIDGNVTVYCTVSPSWTTGDRKILKINNNKVDSVSWKISRNVYSVWAKNNRTLFDCGYGIFVYKQGNWKTYDITTIGSNQIRGNDVNDVFDVGDFGLVAHFNGISWKIYNELYDYKAIYGAVAVKGNLVVMVGQRNGLGLITVGKRN
jgi:hypothetical protein